MKCPNCESTSIQKRGKRAKKQRYFCSNCKASFTENVEYKAANKHVSIDNVRCPKCNSNLIFRDGHLKDGTQRYECRACGLNFSAKTPPVVKIQWDCPYCGGKLKYSGYSKLGNREYKCKECGKSCTGDETGKPIKRDLPFGKLNTAVRCLHCGSSNLRKAGTSATTKLQRYICKECNKTFTQRTVEAVKLVLKGKPVVVAAKTLNYSPKRLQKLMAFAYSKEIITPEQKKDIIKYGYYLKVPVDYMAEYIKCSEHKCGEVLSKYEEKIKSTNPCAI